jgi:type II secretory pathway predicted ATPase ExeA
VIDALGHRTFAALILNPYKSDAEVLRVILRDFGLVSRDEIRRGALAKADTPQLLDTLEGFLRSLLPLHSYAVVIIDEAQSLAPQVLDQIRVLGSYEQDGQRLLQIVLVGQPSLATMVQAERLRALNERITRRLALAPLTASEVVEYIRHRLGVAGAEDRVAFQPDAIALIADLARGLPRRVNLLCDRSLEEGRIVGSSQITVDMVRRAARSIAGAAGIPEASRERGPELAPTALPDPKPESPFEPLELDLDLDREHAEQADSSEREMMLTTGQPERRRRARMGWMLAAAVLIAGALVAGGYAWMIVQMGSGPLPAPPAPKLNIGSAPPAVALPSDQEVEAALVAIRNAQK